MRGVLRRLFATRTVSTTPSGAARILSLRQPPAAVYAVGDVHGCRTLYRALEDAILTDAAARHVDGAPVLIVLLGDLVDRGPDCAGLIEDMLAPPPDGVERVVLRGNHEEMMLRAMVDPAAARDWLAFGGAATLASYGIMSDVERGFDMSPARLSALLAMAIPPAHRRFLAALPYGLQFGDYFLCHAGIDPARSLSDQRPADLIWGPPERIDTAPQMPALPVIVHGHVIVPDVQITARRINLDTGAYATGTLSAVRLVSGDAPFVLSVGAHRAQNPALSTHTW